MNKRCLAALSTLLLPVLALAQTPLTGTTLLDTIETPPLRWERMGQYVVYEDSTVTDSRSRLMWMRCPYGQLFDVRWGTCTGTAERMIWDEANALTLDRIHGHNDWRLPSRDELLALTEGRSGRPPIDRQAFPATPKGPFWSSTPHPDRRFAAWYVYFDHGGVAAYGRGDYPRYVRLIRTAPPLPGEEQASPGEGDD